ncbi:MAG TPA: AmmeMemoRadiSam system protein B [Candidatus Aminicenantes bacterium]|nr:AmmeMemoRadiSam system protein B [Candidatus Aminicenantes bacterium]HRY64173.1 AmmeMemoRadiSam system protein B [Candidatus Aminicenantes bacterium]HRZ71086.1 AmmeMemoRadiSam system protein B [Candidatus Aminicenantes bacterium]
MTKPLLPLAALLVLAPAALGQGLRPAAFAGQFYPGDPARLAADVDAYLAAAAPSGPPAAGCVLGLVAPHAGYMYSGRTAAAAYAVVRGLAIDTVVVIGPSHRYAFEGASIWPNGGFETPLGTARVDADLARAIARASGFRFRPEAFAEEHSVEVQLPFIQRALPGAAVVPIVMGAQTRATIRSLAAALTKACRGRKVLVVASTDLSHYLPEKKARAADAATAALIEGLETETLIRRTEAGENIMCGGGGVAALLLYAARAGRAEARVLARTDSASFGGPVVGYLAAAVRVREDADPDGLALTAGEKAELLKMARAALTAFLERGATIDDRSGLEKLRTPRGAFVTLTEAGDLRGCIGFIEPVMPLGQAVIRCAIYAATEDPRFPPVSAAELGRLRIEISVLTPAREIGQPGLVQVGRHGLIVERDGRKGVLLPQVPVENGWDRETFLAQGSLKAGLPADAWKRGAKLSVFEAIVFRE